MGMDGVELIMAVEEAFEIQIPDEEAEQIRTVIDLYTLIWSKLPQAVPPRGCQSSATFYRIRRALMEQCGIPRWEVRPAARLEALLPPEQRREDWRLLRRTTGMWLPELELPQPMSVAWTAFGWVVLSGCLMAYFVSPLSVALGCSLAGLVLTAKIQERLNLHAVQVPASCATVGSAVRYAVARTSVPSARGKTWKPEEVWNRVRRLIAHEYDIPLEEVTPQASFVDDLGFG